MGLRGTRIRLVIGGIGIVVAMIVFVPLLLLGGMAVAGLLGFTLEDDAEKRYEGSEYVDLGKQG